MAVMTENIVSCVTVITQTARDVYVKEPCYLTSKLIDVVKSVQAAGYMEQPAAGALTLSGNPNCTCNRLQHSRQKH